MSVVILNAGNSIIKQVPFYPPRRWHRISVWRWGSCFAVLYSALDDEGCDVGFARGGERALPALAEYLNP